MKQRMRSALSLGLAAAAAAALATGVSWASSPREILDGYARQAGVGGFSAERGKELYLLERTTTKGPEKMMSCTSCHTSDPTESGKTRAGKEVKPLAPSANPARFTDAAKVEKWFRRNCNDVLQRECTAREKGDFITYLLSVRK